MSNPNPALMELPSSTLEAIERKHGQSEALRIAKLPAVEQHAELHRLIQLEKEERPLIQLEKEEVAND